MPQYCISYRSHIFTKGKRPLFFLSVLPSGICIRPGNPNPLKGLLLINMSDFLEKAKLHSDRPENKGVPWKRILELEFSNPKASTVYISVEGDVDQVRNALEN